MKKVSVVLLLLLSIFGWSQIKWMTLSQALEAQKISPKKILINFYSDGYEACKMMDKGTYGHAEIAQQINENYYPVKFNAEGSETITFSGKSFNNTDLHNKTHLHEFTKYMNVSSVPSIVFLDEQNNPITILNGLLSAREVEPYLSMISKNDYKKIKTRKEWDDYQKKFRSKIKD